MSERPIIRRENGTWVCEKPGVQGVGTGRDPFCAYVNWQMNAIYFAMSHGPFMSGMLAGLRFPRPEDYAPVRWSK